jgi:hypothetical protein
VSGAPGDLAQNSSASGIFRSRHTIIHRTVRCTPDSVRCSKRTRLWNLAASGIRSGCSAIIHRTCPVYTGLSGVTAGQRLLRRQRSPADAFNARQKRAVVRHAGAGAPDTPQFMSGAPPDIKAGPVSELQRSKPQRSGDVAVAPDMSGEHRTVRCAIEPTALTNG